MNRSRLVEPHRHCHRHRRAWRSSSSGSSRTVRRSPTRCRRRTRSGWSSAVVSGLLAMALLGLNWLGIVRHGGSPAPWRRGLAWFFVGQLGKYVPGGIWPIVGQAELAHRDRTPRSLAYSSTAMSMVAMLFGADGDRGHRRDSCRRPTHGSCRSFSAWVCCVGFARPGVAQHPSVRCIDSRIVSPGANCACPRQPGSPALVARYVPVWVLFSGMNIFCVRALGGTLDASLVVDPDLRHLRLVDRRLRHHRPAREASACARRCSSR